MKHAGMKGKNEKIYPKNVEKTIMESQQSQRRKKLLKETKQVPVGERAKNFNKISSC